MNELQMGLPIDMGGMYKRASRNVPWWGDAWNRDGTPYRSYPSYYANSEGKLTKSHYIPRENPSRFGATQGSLDFGGSFHVPNLKGRDIRQAGALEYIARRGGRRLLASAKALGAVGTMIELGIAPAIAVGGAITGAAQWGTPTGLSEDYVGGAVYGGMKGMGAGAGQAIGSITGSILGGAIGSFIPGFGTMVGVVLGGIAGSIYGEKFGGDLLQDPARFSGMAARSIVRTQRAIDRVQFGGSFVDSRGAYTMRQAAVQAMSGSMMNARQYLGNEAIFLHER